MLCVCVHACCLTRRQVLVMVLTSWSSSRAFRVMMTLEAWSYTSRQKSTIVFLRGNCVIMYPFLLFRDWKKIFLKNTKRVVTFLSTINWSLPYYHWNEIFFTYSKSSDANSEFPQSFRECTLHLRLNWLHIYKYTQDCTDFFHFSSLKYMYLNKQQHIRVYFWRPIKFDLSPIKGVFGNNTSKVINKWLGESMSQLIVH